MNAQDTERLLGWIEKCLVTMPVMQTIAGKAYEAVIKSTFHDVTAEIKDGQKC